MRGSKTSFSETQELAEQKLLTEKLTPEDRKMILGVMDANVQKMIIEDEGFRKFDDDLAAALMKKGYLAVKGKQNLTIASSGFGDCVLLSEVDTLANRTIADIQKRGYQVTEELKSKIRKSMDEAYREMSLVVAEYRVGQMRAHNV